MKPGTITTKLRRGVSRRLQRQKSGACATRRQTMSDEKTASGAHVPCVDLLARCYICSSTHDVRMSPEWLTGLGKPWCFECFVAWYDYGKTDIEEVRAKSLELQAANATSEPQGSGKGDV